MKIHEVHALAYREFIFQPGAFPGGFLDVFDDFVLVYRYYRLNGSAVDAVSDILYRQQIRSGDKYQTEFAASHVDDIVFVSAIQHRHYKIALFKSHGAEHIGNAV